MTNTTPKLSGYHITEKIYDSTRTLIYRGQRQIDDQAVIIKCIKNESPTFQELLKFSHQYMIAKNLEMDEIIHPYCLEPCHNGLALVMEDIGAISLSEYIKSHPLTIEEFFEIALAIIQIIEKLHQNRVIHKEIKPQNLLIHPTTYQIKLIDFSISSLLSRENQTIQNPNILEGTLVYTSPEQTGRMNRSIDYRTDFYSLGVTFYELLTEQWPFQSDDPMTLIYAHLVQEPLLPIDINPDIPEMVNDIIVKLMAKRAEYRYQSAFGIKQDLEICQLQWQQNSDIPSFELGQRDISDRFTIPEKLYGRETEIEMLLAAFDRVSKGSSEMMLVTGFSGIGKTNLVHELHKPIIRQRGYFMNGKFEPLKHNIPFSALVQAFQALIHQLINESQQQVQAWKTQLLQALGHHGQVIIEVIPALERIIGPQPSVPELEGLAAKNRFNLLFEKFINVLATAEHPLVIFLDDLQWIDSASLKLIKLLMSQTQNHALLIIGAYRNNEVNAAHPLILGLDDIRQSKAVINQITLKPLSKKALNQLIADTLTCPLEQAEPLTASVLQKTQGNPFFTNQFLKFLHEEELISYDIDRDYWQYDISKINNLSISDDIVEFLSTQLRKWPIETQKVLKLAACIGHSFDLTTLAIVYEKSLSETAADLWKALQQNLILPISVISYQLSVINYQLVTHTQVQSDQSELSFGSQETIDIQINHFKTDTQHTPHPSQEGNQTVVYSPLERGEGCVEGELCVPTQDFSIPYKFLHDYVQQAAYSLVLEHEKASMHLKIGQLLKKHFSFEQVFDDKWFHIINQLNQSIELITVPKERNELAQMNFQAGRKALASTAYTAANKYFTIGIELLANQGEKYKSGEFTPNTKGGRENLDSWQTDYDLMLALYESAAEAAYLSGDFAQQQKWVEMVITHAQSPLEKVKVYEILAQSWYAQNKPIESLNTILVALKQFGIRFPLNPTASEIQQILKETKANWSQQPIENLVNLPQMTEPNPLAIMRLLSNIWPPILVAKPFLLPLVTAQLVNLSITYGNAPLSAFGYTYYGFVLCSMLGDIENGYQFGQLGLKMLEQFEAVKPFSSKILVAHYCCINHWKDHLKVAFKPLLNAYQSALESGDVETASHSVSDYIQDLYFSGTELTDLEKEATIYYEALTPLKPLNFLNWIEINVQTALNLQGKAKLEANNPPCRLMGEIFNEESQLPLIKENEGDCLCNLYINKLTLCYLFHQYPQAVQNADLAEPYLINTGVRELETSTSLSKKETQGKCKGKLSGIFRLSSFTLTIFYFYDSLARLALYPKAQPTEQIRTLKKVATNQHKMQNWAKQAPMNFQHKFDLVEAEQYRVLNKPTEAITFYDRAIKGAKEHEYQHEQALANELAAQFYLAAGKQQIAPIYLTEAYYGYARWGAKAKVDDLETRYPQLLTNILGIETTKPSKIRTIITDTKTIPRKTGSTITNTRTKHGKIRTTIANTKTTPRKTRTTIIDDQHTATLSTTRMNTSSLLDLSSMLKASQAISDENVLGQLIEKFMQIVMENAGSNQGILILKKQQQFWLEAQAIPDLKACRVTLHSLPLAKAAQDLLVPTSVINTVVRNKIPLVFNDASRENSLMNDRYMLEKQPKSVLGQPILYHGQLTGVLYLENNLIPSAFTSDRLIVLKLLSSQMAISLENAQTMAHLDAKVADRTVQLNAKIEELIQTRHELVQSEKMASLGRLVAGFAHELNTPIGVAVGTASTLQQNVDLINQMLEQEEVDEEELVSTLDDINSTAKLTLSNLERAAKLVSSFKRTAIDQSSDEIRSFYVKTTIFDVISTLQSKFKQTAIEFKVDCPNELVVYSMPGALEQILTNLLMNSLIHGFSEGKEAGCIMIIAKLEGEYLHLEYSDTGKGIASEHLAKIFEPFFTTYRAHGGSGLGLYICYNFITSQLNGTITCDSKKDQGVRFVIDFPIPTDFQS
jgi:predicted ATPase/signal transduction histidine kinase